MIKVMVAIFGILLTFSSFAQAEAEWFVCDNGDVATVGDGYFKAELFEDGFTLYPYESGGIGFNAGDLVYTSSAAIIKDQKVVYESEGTQVEAVINGSVTYNYGANDEVTSVVVKISFDNGPEKQYNLACKPGTP